MPITTLHGVALSYRIVGDRGPFLALVSGGRRGHQELVPLAEKIAAAGFRVLLHDRRNTGASDIVIGGGASEEEIWADDLHALLAQQGALPAFVGGSSSGARLAILTCLRHPDAVRGLTLLRVTGGAFAAGRLPENYYGQFIRAAEEGGMAAVCDTEQYRERITANPANRERLLAIDPAAYIEVMSRWRSHFVSGAHHPVMGVSAEELAKIRVPVVVIPGNDKIHASTSGRAAHELIPGSELHALPITDQDVPLIPFEEWAPYEAEIAAVFVDFMRRAIALAPSRGSGRS
ncbi:MAG: alpha/beta hydrolase family protein [Rhodospirillales bacterium]|nr:alpha/beta hydrolase family protein [Rhodospirillales bacterium]